MSGAFSILCFCIRKIGKVIVSIAHEIILIVAFRNCLI